MDFWLTKQILYPKRMGYIWSETGNH